MATRDMTIKFHIQKVKNNTLDPLSQQELINAQVEFDYCATPESVRTATQSLIADLVEPYKGVTFSKFSGDTLSKPFIDLQIEGGNFISPGVYSVKDYPYIYFSPNCDGVLEFAIKEDIFNPATDVCMFSIKVTKGGITTEYTYVGEDSTESESGKKIVDNNDNIYELNYYTDGSLTKWNMPFLDESDVIYAEHFNKVTIYGPDGYLKEYSAGETGEIKLSDFPYEGKGTFIKYTLEPQNYDIQSLLTLKDSEAIAFPETFTIDSDIELYAIVDYPTVSVNYKNIVDPGDGMGSGANVLITSFTMPKGYTIEEMNQLQSIDTIVAGPFTLKLKGWTISSGVMAPGVTTEGEIYDITQPQEEDISLEPLYGVYSVALTVKTRDFSTGEAIEQTINLREGEELEDHLAGISTETTDRYSFAGWTNDEVDYSNEADYTGEHTALGDGLVIYAYYKINTRIVTLMYMDGVYQTIQVNYGDPFDPSLTVPPTKDGYTFKWWTQTQVDYNNLTQIYENDGYIDSVTKDETLYAYFEVVIFPIYFYVNDNIHTRVDVPYGKSVSEITTVPVPEVSGFDFLGWSESDTENTNFDLGSAITESKTLYAVLERSSTSIEITFICDDPQGILPPGGTPQQKLILDGTGYGDFCNDATICDCDKYPGFTFEGWTLDPANPELFDCENTLITESITLYPVFTDNRLSIRFFSDEAALENNEPFHTARIPSGEALDLTTIPTPDAPDGYKFMMWDMTTVGGDITNVTTDLDFVAIYEPRLPLYDVSFYVVHPKTGVSTLFEVQQVEEGNPATRPTRDVEVLGYDFLGWAEAYADLYDFSQAITADLTLYAKLQIKTFDIILIGPDGELDNRNVAYGETETIQTIDVEGYKFLGWYTDSEFTQSHPSSFTVTEDLTLYGKYEKLKVAKFLVYTESLQVWQTYSIIITTPGVTTFNGPTSAPRKEGYTLESWHSDSSLSDESKIVFPVIAEEGEYGLYPKYTIAGPSETRKYAVEYYEGDTLLHTQTIIHGEQAQEIVLSHKDGYTFSGWYTSPTEQTDTTKYNFLTKVIAPITLYTGWVEDDTCCTIPYRTPSFIYEGDDENQWERLHGTVVNRTARQLHSNILKLKECIDYICANGVGGGNTDLTNYYNKQEINNLLANLDLSNYYNKQEIHNLLDGLNTGNLPAQYRINNQTEDYTTQELDFNGSTIIRCLKETDQVITITKPTDDFLGNTLTIRKVGWDNTSTVTILPGDGVTLLPADANVLRRSGSTVTLIYVEDGVFDVYGELA